MKPAGYPIVVSTVNLKGGVGKTTLCVNLAYALSYFKDKRVLVVDLDPQANATQYLISQASYRAAYIDDPPKKLTVVDVYQEFGGMTNMLMKTPAPLKNPDRYLQRVHTGNAGYLDLVASRLELGLIAFQGGNVQQSEQIRWLLQSVGNRYDVVFIDCPPTISGLLMASLEASQHVLIPIKPEFLSTIGVPLMHRMLTEIYPRFGRRADWLGELSVLGMVLTMVDSRLTMTAESINEIAKISKRYNYPVFESRLSLSTKFTWSSKHHLPVFRVEPSSRYSVELKSLTDEFVKRIGLP